MEETKCSKIVKELLKEDGLRNLYSSILKGRNFAVSCFDCRNHEPGSSYTKAFAYFSAPHLEDTENQQEPKIVVCSDKLESKDQIRRILKHEMVHAYDHCVSQKDLTRCEELACSEVRAAREGECRDNFNNGIGELCGVLKVNPLDDELPKGHIGDICGWFKKKCARDHALRSTTIVFPIDGPRCVKSVFDRCYVAFEPQTQPRVETNPGVNHN